MARRRTLSLVLTASLLAACGGEGDSSPVDSIGDPVDTASETQSNDGNEAATTAPVMSTGEPTAATSMTSAPTTIVIDVTEATPWRVELPPPTGTMLDGWVDQSTVEHTPTEPPDRMEAQLAWVYEDLIELWRGDPHLVGFGLNDDVLELPHRETSPRAAIDLIGGASTILRDSYVTIAVDAERAIAAGSPGEQLLAAWSELARNWEAATELVRLGMAEARDFTAEDQACFVTIVNGDDDCDGPGADSAFTMMSELGEGFEAIDAVELDPVGSYGSDFGYDECAAWDAAVAATGLTPDEELRIWIAIDDSDLDRMFVGISECAWLDDGEEDSQPDDAADKETFLAYLSAVAEAIIASGYDETVYDFGSGAEDEQRYYEFTSAQATQTIVTAARNPASELWLKAYDAEFATKLYVVASIEIDDWTQLDDRRLDWEDLGNRMCDGWTMAIEGYSAEQRTAIDAAVGDLGLGGTLIPEGCS